MLTVAIWNLKGGTGKSSTALNLGAELAIAQFKTVLIDLDGQRTLSYSLGMDRSTPNVLDWLEGRGKPLLTEIDQLYLVPGDIGTFQLFSEDNILKPCLRQLKGFDVCLIDCPPSLSAPTLQAIWSADRVLMPTLAEPASLKGVIEAVGLVRDEQENLPVDVLRTRYRSRLKISREVVEQLVAVLKPVHYRLLKTTIPDNVAISESIARQVPARNYATSSPGAIAYRDLAIEVISLWKLGPLLP
ncbi:ParA family protein [filamentous cyanobacterium CCP5]|nr:ParA family protein [filamentous cyanobacterium CCP5]